MAKKALKGLSGIKIFELLENTETEYKVGEAISIPYAQKLTRDIQSSSDPIYADDEIYDDEEVFDGEDFDLEIPEADLNLMSIFEGGIFEEETGEYIWSPDATRNEYGMTFKAKKKDGKYRMFKYYRCKFKKAKQDLQTQDNGTQVATITISGTFYKRSLIENIGEQMIQRVRTIKDSETIEDLKWLETIPTVPTITVTEPEKDPEQSGNEEDLSTMTKEQLLAKATELGITEMTEENTEAEIIAAIQAKLNEVQE